MSVTTNVINEYADQAIKVADEAMGKWLKAMIRECDVSTSRELASKAIKSLIKMSPYNEKILRKVLDLSIHKNEIIRILVADKLKDLQCQELFNLLVTMLDDKNKDVRMVALASLSKCQYYFY